MTMQKYKLEELGEFKNGVNFSSDKMGSGYPLVNVKDVTDNCLISDDKLAKVNLDLKPDSEYLAKEGDLFFVRSSVKFEGAGKVGLIRNLKEDTTHCGFIIRYRLTNKNINPLFLLYLFNAPSGRERLRNLASGATIFNISQTSLKTLEIEAPPLPTQRKIASILSAYDDLIENNLKRIKLLEEKAFLSYKLIGKEEKMEVEAKLEDLIQTVKRKAKIPKSDYKETGDFPIIDQSTDFIGGYTNEKEVVYEELPMIVFGDHTRILKYINFPFACGADGTQLIKPNNPSISVAYLYFELISCNLSNYHYARHFKFLKEQVIKLPSEKVMLEYTKETDKIFNLIQVLRLQNNKLREAQDILLPRLMSGHIEV
ncbi:MAG: restriction endonuclease subunit S [Chitinophagia bacterium]|nr:restriction endonuclease subunit S [Chitinophagia bacterium]